MKENIFQLKTELRDLNFVLSCSEFRETRQIRFDSPQESRDFLVKYLLLECISGVNYSENEFFDTLSKLEKLVRNGVKISYLELPIHPQKKKKNQEIQYLLEDNICYLIKNPAT